MTGRVAYHHPDNDRLSINYVSFDRKTAEERVEGFGDREIGCIEEYDLNDTIYVVYRGTEVPDATADLEYEIRDEVAEMETSDQIITTRVLNIFESIAEEKYEQEEERLAAYKQIEIGKIPDALQRVTWNESVAGSAGELLSCLILRHALPNANHRTSLGMLSLYYQAISSQFEMPATATKEYDWEGWVNEYIKNSKKLLTIRRNVPRFSYLYDAGCTVVERKDGLRIHLGEYDLSMGHWSAMETYAEEHKELSVEFAQNILERAGTLELRQGDPLSKKEFANQLQRMD